MNILFSNIRNSPPIQKMNSFIQLLCLFTCLEVLLYLERVCHSQWDFFWPHSFKTGLFPFGTMKHTFQEGSIQVRSNSEAPWTMKCMMSPAYRFTFQFQMTTKTNNNRMNVLGVSQIALTYNSKEGLLCLVLGILLGCLWSQREHCLPRGIKFIKTMYVY